MKIKGFTLVKLLVIIALIGILSNVSCTYQNHIQKAILKKLIRT